MIIEILSIAAALEWIALGGRAVLRRPSCRV